MKDSLDLLLKEALKHQLNNKKGVGVKIRLAQIEETVHSAYNNPDNWKFTRFLTLRHTDEKGNETVLGQFREYTYKYSEARKLCRDATPLDHSVDIEYVSGDYWIHLEPSDPPPTQFLMEDLQVIRNYLDQFKPIPLKPLLKELNAEHLLKELRGF
jgi:hypothetical protein